MDDARALSARDRDWLHEVATDRFERDEVGRRRIRRLSDCGLSRAEYRCPTHGPDHARHLVCEMGSACPYCAMKRAAAHSEALQDLWPEGMAVLEFSVPVDAADELKAMQLLKRARVRLTRKLPKTRAYRWLLGMPTGLIAMRPQDLSYLLSAFEETRLEIPELQGVAAKLPALAAAAAVRRLWWEPAARLREHVKAKRVEAVARFPYLSEKECGRRSDGSRKGDTPIPWLSQAELRKLLVAEAREGRDLDLEHCSHKDGNGCACGAQLAPAVVDDRDGAVLVEFMPGTPPWKVVAAGFAALYMRRAGLAAPVRPPADDAPRARRPHRSDQHAPT